MFVILYNKIVVVIFSHNYYDINDKISNTNGLILSTKFLEINPKLNVILLDNSKNIKYNYKFNILKKNISIFKLIDTVNESISNSISHDDRIYNN